MYFKRLTGLLLTSSMLVAGCGKLFNQSPPNAASPNTGFGFEPYCLSHVLPIMKDFMKGSANAADVSGTWDCFSGALSVFEKKVRGSSGTSYSSRELARFFEDFFLNGVQINDRLLLEVMHIKQLFVGGAEDSLTRDELLKLISFASDMKGISLKLLPYMSVYSQGWKLGGVIKSDDDAQFFENANATIQDVAKELSAMIARNDKSYQLGNFIVLMQELEKLYGENWSWLGSLENIMPLVEKLKKTLAGGDEQIVLPNEWRPFALLGSRGYIQYLRYYYFILNGDQGGAGSQPLYFTRLLDDLFSYLGDMVREKPGGRFTKAELMEVLDALRSLFPDLKFTPTFIDEAMKIKRVLFGGSVDEWTPEDFDRARTKMDVIRGLVEKIMDYSQIYSLKWNPANLSDGDAKKYFNDFDKKVHDYGGLLGKAMEASYNLRDLAKLADELQALLPPSRQSSWLTTVKQFISLVVSYKNILCKDQDPTVQKEQWPDFIQGVSDAYNRGLFYYYFLNSQPFDRDPGLSSFKDFVFQVKTTVRTILDKRGTPEEPGLISFTELDQLVDAVNEAQLLPALISVDGAKQLTRILLQRVLVKPEDRLRNLIPQGFAADALEVANKEFGLWIETQHLMEAFFKGVPDNTGLSGAQIVQSLKNATPTEGTIELLQVYDTYIPLALDSTGRMMISKGDHPYNYKSVTMMNMARTIVRLINHSYINDLSRIQDYSGFTQDEANTLFQEVKPFFVGAGVLDPNDVKFATARFLDANLFPPSADGNSSLVSFREGSHLVMMIASGLTINSDMTVAIQDQASGCKVIPAKPSGYQRVPIDCLVAIYRRDFARAFEAMPEMVNFESHLTDDSFTQYLINMLKAAGWVDDQSGTIKFFDLALLPHVIQYNEMMMQKFDRDHNEYIDKVEGMSAYFLFKDMIGQVSGVSWDWVNKAAFAYILRYQVAPVSTMDKIEFFATWVPWRGRWYSISVDRFKLGSIFAYIANTVSSGQKIDLTPPPWAPVPTRDDD